MTDARPTHLVRQRASDAKYVAVCGAKRADGRPRVGVDHAQAHIDGRGMVPCPDCVAALEAPRQLALEVAT